MYNLQNFSATCPPHFLQGHAALTYGSLTCRMNPVPRRSLSVPLCSESTSSSGRSRLVQLTLILTARSTAALSLSRSSVVRDWSSWLSLKSRTGKKSLWPGFFSQCFHRVKLSAVSRPPGFRTWHSW